MGHYVFKDEDRLLTYYMLNPPDSCDFSCEFLGVRVCVERQTSKIWCNILDVEIPETYTGDTLCTSLDFQKKLLGDI